MNLSVSLIFPIFLIAGLLCFFCYYIHAMTPRKGTLEWIARAEAKGPRRFSFTAPLHPMEKKDALPLILLTVIYAVSAFWNLGCTTNPQSFLNMKDNETVSFSTEQTVNLSRVTYYSGLWTGSYILEYSADGVNWESMELDQKYSRLFYWQDVELPEDQSLQGKYFQLTALSDKAQIELGELALFDEDGTQVSLQADATTSLLFDEQDTVPVAPHWMNSAYFDEIYHARTAYEHYRNIDPYEDTHPPLGKIIIMLGVHLFGMTPFGWRFMGTLFGVLMVPLLYVFLKNLFGKTAVAFCGAALFTFDFMHLVQTRIATIDSYGVFFILAMFFFLYRYLALPAGTPLRKCMIPLFFCGLMFGIGVSSKWIVLYGGAGMAVLYFIALFWKCREWPADVDGDTPSRGAWVFGNILFCIFSFVLVPAVIYVLSYIPYARANGVSDLKGLLDIVWENQVFMLTYHQGVMDEHPYSSRWYQWLLDIRPILYYMVNEDTVGYTTRFASFNNPLVSWGGLAALVTMTVQTVRRRCGKGLFILIGTLSQFIPWVIIGRTTFAYHYFPTILFLCIAFAYVMNDLVESGRRWKPAVYGVTGTAAALYALFYPALIGYRVPVWFMKTFIKWFPSWPF